MKAALAAINQAIAAHPAACVAFSGGTDSRVLVDLVFSETPHRPAILYAATGLDFDGTEDFVRSVAQDYGATLHVARPPRTPAEQWERQGWPMLGKANAHTWNAAHRGRGMGFKTSCTACCRALKIAPARRLMRTLGLDLQLTGLRGQTDSEGRGLRAIRDGVTYYQQADRIWICNPLTGWTDTMLRRYVRHRGLRLHPAKARGAETIGCTICGGGAQFTGSTYPITRRLDPAAWRRFIVDQGGGEIILAIKHDRPLRVVRQAIQELGGLDTLADSRPWIFDFLRDPPLPGYDKETGGIDEQTQGTDQPG